MELSSFLYNYFCRPVESYAGYNPVNTVVYLLLLFLISFFVVYPLLRKFKIEFNSKFMIALLPYILFGSALRIIEDLRIVARSCSPFDLGFYFYTPGIYFLTFAVTIASLFISKKICKEDYHNCFSFVGMLFAIPVLAFDLMYFREFFGVLYAALMALLLYFGFVLAVEKIKRGFFADKLNKFALASQALDGSATFVATHFLNCSEQHVVSSVVLNSFPFLFPLIKIILVILLLYAIDSGIKNTQLKNFIKIVVIIIGLATSTRDLLTIGVGTCS
ncbi:MAG: DUF63 family protein [Candidatus Diapherotrites archaeon]|nr:DUF63 family protein [Candidatus Diapherotrites archaeon]